jgi:hypothetical protein
LFRPDFIGPGKDKCDRESKNDQSCHGLPDHRREAEQISEQIFRSLANTPANHDVDYRDVVNLSPLQFG